MGPFNPQKKLLLNIFLKILLRLFLNWKHIKDQVGSTKNAFHNSSSYT